MPASRRSRNAVNVDPSMYMQRYLHYQERHSAWHIYRSIYWAIYLLVESALLLYYNLLGLTPQTFFGISLFVLAIMVVVHGFATSLHLKLMKKYG